MYIFMATFKGLIMNSKCQQTLVAIGAIGLVGYKVFAQKDEPTQINETVLLINDANKSVEEADYTIEKANASFQKIPLNEYKPDNSTLQASQ